MIDCEAEIYTMLAQALRDEFPDIDISGEFTLTPDHLPHASIVMVDNPVMFSIMDSSQTNEVAISLFEINVFADGPTKKSKCRNMIKVIDNILRRRNFRRMACTPVDNRDNPTIYRLVARYRVATDGEYFYRR